MSDYIVHRQINLEFFDDYYNGLIVVIWQLADILNVEPNIPKRPSLIRAELSQLANILAEETDRQLQNYGYVYGVVEYVA